MFKFTYKYILREKYKYFLYVILAVVNALITVYIPILNSNIIDGLVEKNISEVKLKCVLFFAFSIMALLLSLICNRLFVKIETRASFDINFDCIKKIQKAKDCIVTENNSVYMTQRVNHDSNAIALFCVNILDSTLVNMVYLSFAWFIMFSKSAETTIIVSLFALLDLLIYVVLKKQMKLINHDYKESQAKFFADLNMQLDLRNFIQLHSLYHWFWIRLESAYQAFFEKIFRAQMFSKTYEMANSIVSILAQIVIFAFGGMQVINRSLSIGEFILIITYLNILITSLKYFSDLGKRYQDTLVSYLRIQNILSYSNHENGNYKIKQINTISIKNLSFKYDNGPTLFSKFSYQFQKGFIYGIKGSNGAGKSTLLYLLIGILKPIYGDIFYNDISLKKIDIENMLHSMVAIIDQNICILNDTLRTNILMDDEGKLKKTEKLISSPLFQCKDSNYLLQNLTHLVSDSQLSGGEKQKVTILREMSKEFELLIADEPTSALDMESKEAFGRMLQEIKSEKIIIIITHDKCLEKYFDYVIDLPTLVLS